MENNSTNTSSVFCYNKDCYREFDWLVETPSQICYWILGVASLLFGLGYLAGWSKENHSNKMRALRAITMISLGLSFSLRASLALGTGNQKAIYGTSMFFNYMAAVCVLNMAFILYDTTPMLKNPLVSTERHGRHGVLFLMAFVPFVLLVCGVALMFNPPSVAGRPVGVNLLRALQVLVVLAAMLIVLSFSAQYEAIREVVPVEKIAAALIASLMLALWGVFMCVRSYLPLSNAARDSELVFLFMNYLPITTASAVAYDSLLPPITRA